MMIIDYIKLFLLLLVIRLRGGKNTRNFIRPASLELQKARDEFDKLHKSTAYTLSITPQVCRMEKLLNDRYYNGNIRKIYTTDGALVDTLFIYKDAENKPIFIGSVPLFLDGEFGFVDGFSFVVHVPQEVTGTDAEIAAVINSFKLIGKKFNIVRYA